jgi:hypothetical protein
VATPYTSTVLREAETACGTIRREADRIDEVADGLRVFHRAAGTELRGIARALRTAADALLAHAVIDDLESVKALTAVSRRSLLKAGVLVLGIVATGALEHAGGSALDAALYLGSGDNEVMGQLDAIDQAVERSAGADPPEVTGGANVSVQPATAEGVGRMEAPTIDASPRSTGPTNVPITASITFGAATSADADVEYTEDDDRVVAGGEVFPPRSQFPPVTISEQTSAENP